MTSPVDRTDPAETHLDRIAAHRPYGLDCKCGRPINSDRDWAQHFMEALGLTEEWGVVTDMGHTRAPIAADHARFLAGKYDDITARSRLVGPWGEDRGEQ